MAIGKHLHQCMHTLLLWTHSMRMMQLKWRVIAYSNFRCTQTNNNNNNKSRRHANTTTCAIFRDRLLIFVIVSSNQQTIKRCSFSLCCCCCCCCLMWIYAWNCIQSFEWSFILKWHEIAYCLYYFKAINESSKYLLNIRESDARIWRGSIENFRGEKPAELRWYSCKWKINLLSKRNISIGMTIKKICICWMECRHRFTEAKRPPQAIKDFIFHCCHSRIFRIRASSIESRIPVWITTTNNIPNSGFYIFFVVYSNSSRKYMERKKIWKWNCHHIAYAKAIRNRTYPVSFPTHPVSVRVIRSPHIAFIAYMLRTTDSKKIDRLSQ